MARNELKTEIFLEDGKESNYRHLMELRNSVVKLVTLQNEGAFAKLINAHSDGVLRLGRWQPEDEQCEWLLSDFREIHIVAKTGTLANDLLNALFEKLVKSGEELQAYRIIRSKGEKI